VSFQLPTSGYSATRTAPRSSWPAGTSSSGRISGTDPEIEDYSDRAGSGSGAGSYGRREYYNLPPSRSFLATLRLTF
jgi:hypothetical protein